MKHDSISLRRRYLMIAGVAGVTAPAGLLAATGVTARTAHSVEPLIVSGRIVDRAGKPLAGAVIELAAANATTDGDGRFMLKTEAGVRDGCPDSLDCRIVHSAQHVAQQLDFVRTRVLRDEAGTWRAGVSLSFA